jgi:hypothetical protein
MSKDKDHKARARHLDDMAKSESNIHERLLAMRSELEVIVAMIDRTTMTRHSRFAAGGISRGLSPLRLPRGVVDLVAARKDRGQL